MSVQSPCYVYDVTADAGGITLTARLKTARFTPSFIFSAYAYTWPDIVEAMNLYSALAYAKRLLDQLALDVTPPWSDAELLCYDSCLMFWPMLPRTIPYTTGAKGRVETTLEVIGEMLLLLIAETSSREFDNPLSDEGDRHESERIDRDEPRFRQPESGLLREGKPLPL